MLIITCVNAVAQDSAQNTTRKRIAEGNEKGEKQKKIMYEKHKIVISEDSSNASKAKQQKTKWKSAKQ